MEFYAKVYQNKRLIRVEIRQHLGNEGGYIGAFIAQPPSGVVTKSGVLPPLVIDSLYHEGTIAPEGARYLAHWYQLAAQAADTLGYHIKSAGDFQKTWTVRVIGNRSIVFEEDKN